ncbi:MAG: NAD(P)(+) transhydrogenase (Re/Si-specific) subunit beta, partial [Sneathiellales bacterium]|nr:NAD(P)(+) transhydrogenase (Re/Si-specific) subunit beta [Sneathiellales bacterium]
MSANFTALAYLVSAILFILSLRGLSSPESSRRGNVMGMLGMAIAMVVTILDPSILSYEWIIGGIVLGGAIGVVIAQKIAMTAMPQLVAAFHSLVGLAAVLVAAAAFENPEAYGIVGAGGELTVLSRIEMAIGIVVGAITFSGSVIAFTKLQGLVSGNPVVFPGQHFLNLVIGLAIIGLIVWFCVDLDPRIFWAMTALAFVIGFLIIIPIGGADMPVVVSMLNSYSGWAAAGIGFTLENTALIIVGALVGSSGAILSYIMCKAMNRSFFSVILGGFGGDDAAAAVDKGDRPHKAGSSDDAAFIMKNAGKVIIVPGYGLAVAQAQHALREMVDALKEEGVEVVYAIHPVAGRMPGHMNVLLAEANVP